MTQNTNERMRALKAAWKDVENAQAAIDHALHIGSSPDALATAGRKYKAAAEAYGNLVASLSMPLHAV
jgi:hypothetical protein